MLPSLWFVGIVLLINFFWSLIITVRISGLLSFFLQNFVSYLFIVVEVTCNVLFSGNEVALH